MSIDLTEPIKFCGMAVGPAEDGVNNEVEYTLSVELPTDFDLWERYRQLFQDAPRTKLEHKKMLEMLKRLSPIVHQLRNVQEPVLGLPYEITYHEDGLRALIAEIEEGK